MSRTMSVVAVLLFPSIWCILSYGLNVSERYLPKPLSVLDDLFILKSPLILDLTVSFVRIFVGYSLGVMAGLYLGCALFRSGAFRALLLPNIQAARAIPPAATIPFFLLWFGFSEIGKIVIFVFGISLNLAVAVLQILNQIPERYTVALMGFGLPYSRLPQKVLLPLALEQLLPTLRFSLTVAIGLGVVAEILGSQVGLGYLIQSARTTYSLGIVVIGMVSFGLITFVLDLCVRRVWIHAVPWKEAGAD